MKITKTKRILCLFLALGLFLVSVLPVTLAEENAVIEAPIIDEYLLDEATACEVEANAEADNEKPIEQPEETMESEAEPFVENEEVLVIADEPSEQVDSAEPVLSIAEAVDEYGFCYGKITMATDVYSSPGRTDENRSYTLTSSSSIVLVRSIGEMAEIWFAVNNGDVVNGYVEKNTLDDVAISESAMKDTQMVSATIGNELVDVPVVNANKIEREEQVNTEPPMEEPPVESDETTPDTEAPEAEEPHENVELPETEIDTLQPSDSGELEQNEVIPDSDETNNTIENSSTAEENDVSEDVASEDTPEAEDGEEDEVVGEVPMMATFAMARSFVPSFKPVYANLGSFTVGQTGVHGSSGDDSYKQLAAAPDYGTVYATPHYLDNVTVYCLEHMFDGPGERTDDGSIGETGPYTIVDLETYYHTPGKSGTIFSSRTMHAIAWVMRHSYPYQVLDLNYADNENWCRAACQFAIRQVIKELEGSQFVRYYWDLDSFYRRADSAPEEYLAYARWLADNAIARASITGKINVTNKSTSISGGKYIYSATFTTDADRIRIEKKYGTMTGNSGGSDDTYYYLLSGDKISITSTTANATIKAESLPAPDEEAFFMVGIPAAWLQKVIIPYTGAPWPYQSTSVTFELPYGSLAVVKKDAASSKALKGAVFELLDSSGSVIQTKTTDANGKATFSELPAGSYTVREKAPPEGYTLGSASSQAATVKAGETASLTFKNDLINAKIKIKKIDALTKTPLEGVTFEIKRLSAPTALGNEGVGTSISISTNSEGIAETGWLPWGKYQIVETSCPQHYETPDFSTTIEAYEDGKTYTISVQNEPTKGYIQITKKDELDATPIAGVTFDIFYNDEYGEGLAATMVTDKNGVAVSPALRKGHYIVKEHENPVGYLLDLVSINCSVESDVTTKLTASNCPVQGTIEIHKTDELTGEALAGAEFTITRITGLPSHNGFGEGEVVDVLTTDENGFAKSSLLTWGTYRVEETKVPEHYEDKNFSVDVNITDEVTVCKVDVENEPTKGYIQITKKDELDATPIAGVTFDIFYNDEYGEGLAATMVTDKNGVAVSPALRKGHYIVKEHENPVGYLLDLVSINCSVESDVTTKLTASNCPVQGTIEIHKTDELTGEALAGAEFTITRITGLPSHNGFGEGEVVDVLTTDENGFAKSSLLTWGTYRVEETKVPAHYVDNHYSVDVSITDEVTVCEVDVENEPTKGWISLTKTDRLNGNPIKGVKFDIFYNDAYGEGLAATMTTDANGVAISPPLRKGSYLVKESGVTDGYVFEELNFSAVVHSDETTYLTATNQPVQVQLQIFKRDSEESFGDIAIMDTRGDGILTGAEFQVTAAAKITDRQGNVIYNKGDVVCESLRTDGENAAVLTEPLWPGKYNVVEVTPPTGYQASTKVVSIDATDAAKQSAVAVVTYDAVKTNKILYGAISVVKFLGDNQIHESGVIETPEKGAEFEIYLKSSGSYENARDCERDKIVTNKNGKAKTKALPYGVYVMQQTVGQEGHMLMSPIEFMIDGTEELNDPPTLILNNTAIRYRLRIIKTDAETGKTITLAHTAFKLKDTNGEYVKQSVSYPTPMTIDTFETDENGIVVLPETVKWGHYTIEEVTSPEGYIINSDGVDVFVGHVGDAPEEIYELEVQVPNDPVKGRIVIEKKGNRLVGFETMKDENGMEYMKPVYEYRYLSGVVFDIKAADDVIGKDGTTWYQKGDVVETITTNSEGPVSSSELPLGKYTVEEVQTPDGYYCDPTIYEANLSFVDNQTKVVELQLDIENEYLPIEIHVDKTKDVLRPVTAANEMIHQALSAEPGTGFTFGLYNINTIEYDGGTLEANTLLATATTSDDGKLVFTGYYPHGEYFIRELGGPDGWILSEGRYRVNLQPDMAAEDHVIRVHFSRPIHNKLIHSTVTLTKTDLTGASTVPGALIEVKNSSGETIYREITDENGEIPDIPVTPGCYTFTEVLAPNGYALNEAVMSFEVDAEGNVSGQTVIRDDYSRVVLLKKDGYGQPLEGVVFALVDANDKEIMTAKSNENGEVIFERIPFGKFIIRESQPLPGYKASDVEVELSIDGTFVNPSVPIATITNQLMVLNGVKLDNSGNPHGGAEFCLINAVTGDVVDTATSNADGTFSMSNFEIGYWVLRETKAPEGFSLMKDIDLTVDEFWSEEDVVKCVNIPNHYSFMKINHYWQPLAGVKFAIEDESGNKVQEAISGEDGVVTFTNLNPGTYLIREIEALYGYTRSDETLSVTIDADYMPPKKLKRMVNYPDIETGIDLIFTPTMLMGSFVAILGIAGAVLYRRHMKKKRK